VIAYTECFISLTTLIEAPFNLVRDESILAKVVATNFYGSSEQSIEGNGASMLVYPDPPITLQNDATVTDASKIRFTWTEASDNGGAPVLDYSVFYDQGNGSWTILDTVTASEYQTTIALTADVVYSFKVTARNLIGSSAYSVPISTRAAELPSVPLQL